MPLAGKIILDIRTAKARTMISIHPEPEDTGM